MKNIFAIKDKHFIISREANKITTSIVASEDMPIDKKLKKSEIRYRRLFESAKDGILILDFETGDIVDANPFIIKIIDYPLEDILGKKLWEIGLFSNKEESELAFTELKINGYIRFDDMPIQQRSGKIKEVEFISNVYVEGNSKVIQCNIRDITERKQIERKQEFNTKIISILSNNDNWKQSIKNILFEIRNYTKLDAAAIRLTDDVDYPYYESIGFNTGFIKSGNSICTRNLKGEILYNESGKPKLDCMCGKVISGRTDPSLQHFTVGGSFYTNNSTAFLAETSHKKQPSVTLSRCIAEGYKSIALIPLYSGKDIIGLLQLNDRRTDMFTSETIDFFEKTGNLIGIAFNRIQNETRIKENEKNLLKQNSEYHNLNNEYHALNEELTESIHRIRKINEELISAKVKAEESDLLKTAFLANMSHEIRTPMNAIVGFSGFLLEPDLSREKMEEFIQVINSSSHQLLSVISDIIDISKIEAGLITINSEWVNINPLMNELFVTYTKLVEHKELKLFTSCDLPNETVQIKSDGNRIRQILCNLLNNAIKFTKQGAIEFGYKIKGKYIEFFVEDTGMGINPENYDLIFQRFRQVETSENEVYDGNGLGLSISKALVEKLGGTISVHSNFGKGSTFAFTIPYNTENEKKEPIVLSSSKTKKDTNWDNNTILIVEDEVNNHAYLEQLLIDTNASILHAWDGKEAVEQVIAHPEISLVLMDIKMPIMDGYEATRRIKILKPKLPVIAQTAYSLSEDRKIALEAGCDDYISKPIDRNLLMQKITYYLKSHAQEANPPKISLHIEEKIGMP